MKFSKWCHSLWECPREEIRKVQAYQERCGSSSLREEGCTMCIVRSGRHACSSLIFTPGYIYAAALTGLHYCYTSPSQFDIEKPQNTPSRVKKNLSFVHC
ncbi:hypothetical protein CEUSTIGMA_g8600.t1 [Chlamydomonas eustigma]|uniref:Uncharacterized protein n=1 Tax=Chlamydomonas eustigma TaxID=1157962 RepID=A0A250XDJ9_9CHLO|nr:hypothetical protein CEUSTIGMA_g8600.t1 [Chlamydomonas eustigma]|eukprot:GAX81167.1 hypothetical protein CEUSTIGMA_g8600.t1 [Chlamydomonas eustigma]